LRPFGVLAAATVAALVAGCSTQLASIGSGPAPSNATITFESIDGPPPEVFRRLVAALNDEASAQKIAVVSRSAPASYRIRGYMSALVERNKTSFSWVWDVYDGDKNRVLRISGEEPATAAGKRRDAWVAADEQVLRGMSRNGMERIGAFLNAGPPTPGIEPEVPVVTVAATRDDSPEAAGIYRAFGSDQVEPAAAEAENVPAPPEPPKRRKRQASATGPTQARPTALAESR
jgi:hypothetical protein